MLQSKGTIRYCIKCLNVLFKDKYEIPNELKTTVQQTEKITDFI